MKFIFPLNYNFKPKILGILDYNTALLNIIWDIFVFCFVSLIFNSITVRIFIIIILCFPIFLFSIIGFNHENIVYVLSYLLKFFLYRCVYIYKI